MQILGGVLINLDLTLVDSRIAESVRRSRRWLAVYEMIPRFTRYEEGSELLAELSEVRSQSTRAGSAGEALPYTD
jgi:hypothetical protein